MSQPHSVDVHVGQALRAIRRAKGVSQYDLAAAVGLTFQQIQKYERAENRISASKLADIAGELGVPISEFFSGLDAAVGESAAMIWEFANLPQAASFMRAIGAVPPRIREEIFRLAIGYADLDEPAA